MKCRESHEAVTEKKVSSLEASQTYFYSLALYYIFFSNLHLKNMYLSVHTIFRINFLFTSLFLLFSVPDKNTKILLHRHTHSNLFFFSLFSVVIIITLAILLSCCLSYHQKILCYLNSALPLCSFSSMLYYYFLVYFIASSIY